MTSARTRLALLLAAILLGGCTVLPPAHDYDPTLAVTVHAPPPPLVEYRGQPPAFGYVWLEGYWNWAGIRYDWVPGRWVNPPPGRIWVPRVWRHDGDRWHSHGGHWGPQAQRLAPQPVWPRREFHSQPDPRPVMPLPRPDRRPERPHEPPPQASHHSAPHLAQPAVPVSPGLQRRTEHERHASRPDEPGRLRPAPPPSEAVSPQRRPDEGRRFGRHRLEEGEPGTRP